MAKESTILIVDDEAVGRETLEGVLFGRGYELAFAGNGAETLAKAAELVPDLILLDVMMPDMDGFEVCQRLRANRLLADVPIIMVTALDDRESRLQGIEAGADDFLTKPFDRLELRARVRTITRLNRYRRLLTERIRFEWVVERSGDGYLVLNEEDGVLYANSQARLYLGIHSLESRLRDLAQGEPNLDETKDQDKPIAETFLDLAKRQYRCEPQAAWSTWGRPSSSDQLSPRYLVRPESETANAFWLQVDVLDLPSGSDSDRVIRLRDITSEVARQRDMRGFHEAITHKMRTPLTIMLGSLSLLARRGHMMDGENVVQLSTNALAGTERLRDTIEDVFQYLHVSSLTKPDARFDLGQLQPMVEEIGSHLEIESVTVSCPKELRGSRLRLSRQGIELILWETLENAKKFHPQQNPSVEVTVSHTGPTEIRLQIQDDGVTVSPEHLAKLWTPYYQGEKYFTGEAKGMGLGLPAIAAMVWEVGGTCHARNRADGPGVTIELVLLLEE